MCHYNTHAQRINLIQSWSNSIESKAIKISFISKRTKILTPTAHCSQEVFNLNIKSISIEQIINNECKNNVNSHILKELNTNERSQLLFEYMLSNGRNKNKSAGTSSSLSIKEFFESCWEKRYCTLNLLPLINHKDLHHIMMTSIHSHYS